MFKGLMQFDYNVSVFTDVYGMPVWIMTCTYPINYYYNELKMCSKQIQVKKLYHKDIG